MSVLRVAGAQIENEVGDVEGNRLRILEAMAWAEEREADVLVLPELALTGYPLEDLVLRGEFLGATQRALESLALAAGRTTTVVGTVDVIPPRRGRDTKPRTATIGAALLCDGEIRGIYHKVLLPHYELFDEPRNFAAGTEPAKLWRIGGTIAGVCICEDLWSGDGPPEAQAAAGAQVLLVPNASPFHREKPKGRRELASTVARRCGVPVVYVNCVGGHDDLVFDGGSLIVDADGTVRYRAEQFTPDRFCVDVPLARRPLSGEAETVHVRLAAVRDAEPPPPPPPQADGLTQVWQALVLGTRDFARKNARSSAVLGLSGGIDSALTAAVAADALGPENVLGVAMPSRDSPAAELSDARKLAANLGIGFEEIPIAALVGDMADGLARVIAGRPTGGTSEELEARVRGSMLMAIADELGHMVLATGNKSELSIGTGALYGDMAGDFAPIKDCPKTLLYHLAAHRNSGGGPIPEHTIRRKSSMLRDKRNALPPYEVLDPVVERYIEEGEGLEEIVAAGFDPEATRGILQLIDDAEFKRRQTPPGVKITARAFGMDRRMPISNAWRPFRVQEIELVGADLVEGVGVEEHEVGTG